MRKVLALILIAFSGISIALAQDIITLQSGQDLNGRIIRMNPEDIIYMPQGSTDTTFLSRSVVLKVHYQNGTTVILTDKKTTSDLPEIQNDSMYIAGAADAKLYYQSYIGASTGTLVAGLIFPWNLIPAIACAATPPSTANLDYPSQKLMEDQSYNLGYKKQAHAIKKKKVWNSFAIGSGVMIGVYLIVSVVAASSY